MGGFAMAMASDVSVSGQMRDRWGWFVALGILMIIAGVIALMSVLMATVVSVLLVGIMMIASGIVEVVHGFQMKAWGRFFLWILIGALYIVAGLMVVWNPLFASAVLTLVLGVFLVFAGVARIFLAMQMRSASPWGWVLASGIITLLLGAIIISHWPVSGLYVLGIFLGVDLVIAGASWLGAGLAFRRAA
jgi:uncharacterized membrane protein HdeD (DUF308 family)